MPLSLQFRSALLLAASAWSIPVIAQGQGVAPSDPFADGSYAIPTGESIKLGGGDPLAASAMTPQPMTMSGPISSGPVSSGPMASGNSVFMAPEIVGGSVPGGANCPSCNSGGAPLPGGMPYGTQMPGAGFGPPPSGVPMGPGAAPMGPALGSPMPPAQGVPLGGAEGPETIYPGFVDPSADVPAGTGYQGFGGGGVPPVVGPPRAPGGFANAGAGQRCGWAAGFTWVFLRPLYSGNTAFDVATPRRGGFNVTNQDFNYDLDLSPRVFIEWVAPNDFGFRATWFSFDNDADNVSGGVGPAGFIRRPISPTRYPGGKITAGSNVNLDTLDFDLTQRLNVYRSLLNLGVGLRWANYENNYNSVIRSPEFGQAGGHAGRQFNGFGPTVFAEWRRPVGATRFSVLANVRGSMLYGESKTDRFERRPSGEVLSFHSDNDDFVAVGETQLGGEWSAWISNRTVFFVQAAFEAQYWMGVGTAFDRNDDLGLIGVNTTVGLEW